MALQHFAGEGSSEGLVRCVELSAEDSGDSAEVNPFA